MKSVVSVIAVLAFGMLSTLFVTPANAQAPAEPSLVTVKTFMAASKLAPGQPVEVLIVVQVQKPWHINSNPANPDYLIPTEFKLVATEGSKVDQLKYPKAGTIKMDGIDEPVHVYEGEFAIFGKITAPAEAAGKTESLDMQLHYQACNDQKCLQPNKVSIKGKVPVAAVGEALEPQNQKLFEKYRPKPEEKKK